MPLSKLWTALRSLLTHRHDSCQPPRRRRLEVEVLEDRVCPSSAATSADVRYASSSNRIYVTGDVVATLSDLDALLPSAPLDLVDAANGIWLLRANIVLEQGARLDLHGTGIGGDVNELRLLSDNTGAANSVVEVMADWGTIDIDNTKITSWDTAANGPDTEHAAFQRAFIRARSKFGADGVTPLESTLNVRASEISHLGFNAAECYGLSWKVLGAAGADYGLYDSVNVYGGVTDSHIHDSFWGGYALGGQDMQWLDNSIHDTGDYALRLFDTDNSLLANNAIANGRVHLERGIGNTLDGNTLADGVLVAMLGATARQSLTHFRNHASVRVQVDANSTAQFQDAQNAVFDAGSPSFTTTVSTSGSSAVLTSAMTGGFQTVVFARNFHATLSSSSVVIAPTLWETAGDRNKEWTTQATTAAEPVTYSIGELTPNEVYRVRKQGGELFTLTADADGVISFTDVPGGTQAITYRLEDTTPILSRSYVRYASSTNRIYITGPVTATLSEIKALLPTAPLDLVDAANGVWLLRANLFLEEGARINLHGTAVGGDVNVLRLLSNNSSAANSFVEVRADWGTIDIHSTTITSWDQAVNGPDTEYAVFQRAFIRARSSLAADGVTPQQSTLNIHNSDIGYLGYKASESYGLSWKVLGDATAIPDLFDRVDVFGDVVGSRLHHNYYGAYTWGAFGMNWLNNEVDNNVGYGLDYHDDSDWIVVAGNNVHHNAAGDTSAAHGIIFSKRCDHAVVRNNISSFNFGNGIMMHILSDDALIEGNTVNNNGDAGIALFDSYRSIVRNNISERNQKGIRLSVGSAHNQILNNTLANNSQYGVFFFKGSDSASTGVDRPHDNLFEGNRIFGNVTNAIKLTQTLNNTFRNNEIAGLGDTIYLDGAIGNRFEGNTLVGAVLLKGRGSVAEPSQAIVVNQPSIRVQVDGNSTVVFTDPNGAIFDVGNPVLGTTATASGSTLTITQAKVGTGVVLVTTRALRVKPSTGQALVTPLLWESGGQVKRQWLSQASTLGATITYTMGGLQANQLYTVTREGKAFGTFLADANGVVNFSDVATTTGTVAFSMAKAATGSKKATATTSSSTLSMLLTTTVRTWSTAASWTNFELGQSLTGSLWMYVLRVRNFRLR